MKISRLIAFSAALAATMTAAHAAEGSMSLDKLPPAAQATVRAHTANAKILSVKREEDHQFEVESLLNGRSHDLLVDEKGRLLSVEDEMDLALVPAQVQATIRKEAGTATIKRVEKVTEGDVVSYEAELAPAGPGKKFEVRVREDGSLQSKQDDEDKDKGKD